MGWIGGLAKNRPDRNGGNALSPACKQRPAVLGDRPPPRQRLTDIPVPSLRPLVGMDKQEIVDQARRIGTFDTSVLPDQDCCQLFVPKHPATKARLADVEDAESRLEIAALTQLGVEKAELEEFKFPP